MKKQSVILMLDGLKKLYGSLEGYKCIEHNYDEILGKPMDLLISGIVDACGYDYKEDYPFVQVCDYIFGYTTEEETDELYRILFDGSNLDKKIDI